MKIRAEQNPTRRLEPQGRENPLRVRAAGTASRTPVSASADARGASGPAALSQPVDRVSVQPRILLPLPWGEDQLEVQLQVAVEAVPGVGQPGPPAGAPAAAGHDGKGLPRAWRRDGENARDAFRVVLGLSPPRLGPVQVVLRFREGAVEGEILVAGAAASRAVEQALPELKERLRRWLTVEGLKVRLLAEAVAGQPIPFPPAEAGSTGPARKTRGRRHGRLDLHA